MWAKQVWLKDGKLQTYSNKWEDANVWPTPTPVPVTGVSLDQSSATLQPEGTLQLTATITPSDATNKKVTWTTSNNAIATVSSTGLVTAVANGEATITVKTRDGNFTDTCVITVSTHATPVSSISNFSRTSNVNIMEGGSTTLTFDYLPVDAWDFSDITFLQDVESYDSDVEVSASVTSYTNWVATLTIQGIDAGDNTGTYGLKVYLNGQDTGTIIVWTVFKAVTVTLESTSPERWTVSPASIRIPVGSSADDSVDVSVVTFSNAVIPDFTATATATWIGQYTPSNWEDGQGGVITRPLNNINQDITLRCSFEEASY